MYEAEKRYQTKENEFMAYKEQQLTKPEVKLESEINLLRMEKVRPLSSDHGLLSFILLVKLVITFEAFFFGYLVVLLQRWARCVVYLPN